MNVGQLLDQAAKAMTACRPSSSCMFVVGYRNKEIVCVPAYESVSLEIQFGRYSSSTIIQGLTTKEWDGLSDRIAKFYFQKGLM